jgi:ubiquinone biosynthesis protein UbiJ
MGAQSRPFQDAVTAPVQRLLDRGVRQSTTAAALCERLAGRSLGVDAGPLQFGFAATGGRLLFSHGLPAAPDALIAGSPINLVRIAGGDAEQLIRQGQAKVSGDTEVAADFQALLRLVRPDWEEELARITGDAIAHEAGRAVQGFVSWAASARDSLGRSAAEYLTEESRAVISRTELEEFLAGVDTTVAAVDRLEARIALLRAARAAD